MSLGVVLFLIFLVLKLVGVITWSWWFVTMPLWIGFVLFLVLGVVLSGIAAIFGGVVHAIRRL